MKRTLLVVAGLLCLAEIVLLVFFNPSDVSFFPPCLFYKVTGLKCPSCGMQRAIHLLIHGRLADSMLMCPMLYAWGGLALVMRYGPKFTGKLWFALTVLSAVLVYWVLRMCAVLP